MFKLIIALDILSLPIEYLIIINFSPDRININNAQSVTEVKIYKSLNYLKTKSGNSDKTKINCCKRRVRKMSFPL